MASPPPQEVVDEIQVPLLRLRGEGSGLMVWGLGFRVRV